MVGAPRGRACFSRAHWLSSSRNDAIASQWECRLCVTLTSVTGTERWTRFVPALLFIELLKPENFDGNFSFCPKRVVATTIISCLFSLNRHHGNNESQSVVTCSHSAQGHSLLANPPPPTLHRPSNIFRVYFPSFFSFLLHDPRCDIQSAVRIGGGGYPASTSRVTADVLVVSPRISLSMREEYWRVYLSSIL